MGLLSGIETRCRTALRELGQSSEASRRLPRMQPVVVRTLLDRAVAIVSPTIHQMIMSKYKASKIKRKSGELEAALRNLQIKLIWKGKRPVLNVSLPPGLDAKLYAYAASLNYGAVRQPQMQRQIVDLPSNNEKARVGVAGVIGEKAKKTLKRQVTGDMAQSHRADVWRNGRTNRARSHEVIYDSRRALKMKKSYRVAVLARDTESTVIGGEIIEQKNKTVGSFVIIPGRKFFSFSPSEKAYIARLIESEIERLAGGN
jgi:hypothetical protein